MKLRTLLPAVVCCALSACGGSPQPVGLGQAQPGQPPVVSQVPLSVPPDFNLPVTASNASQTQQGALPGTTPDASQSAGEQALLQTAGAANPDPNIRQTVDQEAIAGGGGASQELTDKLAFWQGSAVQPAATGASIKRKSKGWGIF